MFWQIAVRRIKEHNKDVRVIVQIRNPVDRAYSGYWFTRQKGRNLQSFDDEVWKSDKRISHHLNDWDSNDLPSQTGLNFFIYRGIYYLPMANLYDKFERSSY